MTQIVTNQYGTDSYLVSNGVDDVVDTDHNEQTGDIITLAKRQTYDFGDGTDGQGALGSLTNPSTGAPAYLSASVAGAGLLTGSFRYRCTFYNLSGETTATGDPGADVAATAQSLTVTNLPISINTTIVQGRKIYRSADSGSTWKHIATINDNNTTSFVDNNPSTSGASIPGSNTTGNTGTLAGGRYHFTSFTVGSGQTLTLSATGEFGGIYEIRVTGNVDIVGTINGKGKFLDPTNGPAAPVLPFGAASTSDSSTFYWFSRGLDGVAGVLNGGRCYGSTFMSSMNKQGAGGNGAAGTGGTAIGALAGATFILISQNVISISGTITCAGEDGATLPSGSGGGAGGGAGGLILIASSTSLSLTGTLNANGGNGGGTNNQGGGFTQYGGGGGGGGYIILSAPFIADTSTKTVAGGTKPADTSDTAANRYGGGGGGFSGHGGHTNTGTPTTGGVGQIYSYVGKRIPKGYIS